MRKGVVVIISMVIFSSSVMASLDCKVIGGSCGSWTKILGLTNYTNAHVEQGNLSNPDHPYSLCCRDDTYTITRDCPTKILGLNETTDTHVEKAFMNSPDYPYSACMAAIGATVDCLYTDASCPVNYECVVTLNETFPGVENKNSSMHVASCNTSQEPYDEKLCCKITEEAGPPGIPEFSTIGIVIGIIIMLAGSYFIINKKFKK